MQNTGLYSEDEACDGKIDDDSGNVDDRRDKRGGGRSRVDVTEFEMKRKHRSDKRTIDDENADAGGDGACKIQEAFLYVGKHARKITNIGDDKPNQSQCGAKAAADDKLAFEYFEYISQANFTKRHGASDERGRLGTGVSARGHDERDEDT